MCDGVEFDKLARMVQRQQNVSEPVPPFYLKTLLNLESSITSALAKDKESKKKMNASNARALTAVRQKVKKLLKEYEQEIKRYQEVCTQPHSPGTSCVNKVYANAYRTLRSSRANIRLSLSLKQQPLFPK